MRVRARAIFAVATLSILDALRRKDLYVMAILCGLMVAAGRLFAVLGVWGLETFIKDVTFTAVSLCCVVLTILLAARQVPEEISRRTLYPLLARPIRRGELLFGKFLGVVLMSWVALLLATLVALLSLVSLKFSLGTIAAQWLVLRALSLMPIAAMALCLSLYMTPAAAVLISALLTLGCATFARAADLIGQSPNPLVKGGIAALDWLVPRLDLFDLSKKAAFGWGPVPLWVIGALALYALIYTAIPFGVAAVRFRRMAL
jgi:ABC-type transport system involved in multi-copper enzyme maturation permease subunit